MAVTGNDVCEEGILLKTAENEVEKNSEIKHKAWISTEVKKLRVK